MRAWAGLYLHKANRVERSDDPFEDHRLNAFVQLPLAWCKAKVRTGRRRLRNRSDAARAVRPWMRESLDNLHPRVPGVRKFMQRQIALYLCRDDPERSANFQNRVWRPSRPVLHLAIASDLLLCTLREKRAENGVDLASAKLVSELVARAKLVQPLILGDPRFGVTEEDLLQLDWVL